MEGGLVCTGVNAKGGREGVTGAETRVYEINHPSANRITLCESYAQVDLSQRPLPKKGMDVWSMNTLGGSILHEMLHFLDICKFS